MKPVRFEYVRPADLAAAIALGSQTDKPVKFMAGGQSLGPMLNLRLVRPGIICDITSIPELKRVEENVHGITIGSCVTHADIEDGRVADVTGGALRAVAAGIAYRAVRNRGTIGGSIVHADPSADWISALTALGASVVVRGPTGERRVAMDQFVVGVFETSLNAGELVTGIQIPRSSPAARWGYYRASRKTGEFAHSISAFLHDPSRFVCRAVIGATGATPIVFPDATQILAGHTNGTGVDDRAVRDVMRSRGLDAIEQQVHLATLRRAIAQAHG